MCPDFALTAQAFRGKNPDGAVGARELRMPGAGFPANGTRHPVSPDGTSSHHARGQSAERMVRPGNDAINSQGVPPTTHQIRPSKRSSARNGRKAGGWCCGPFRETDSASCQPDFLTVSLTRPLRRTRSHARGLTRFRSGFRLASPSVRDGAIQERSMILMDSPQQLTAYRKRGALSRPNAVPIDAVLRAMRT
jgi:hypothetical protein